MARGRNAKIRDESGTCYRRWFRCGDTGTIPARAMRDADRDAPSFARAMPRVTSFAGFTRLIHSAAATAVRDVRTRGRENRVEPAPRARRRSPPRRGEEIAADSTRSTTIARSAPRLEPAVRCAPRGVLLVQGEEPIGRWIGSSP